MKLSLFIVCVAACCRAVVAGAADGAVLANEGVELRIAGEDRWGAVQLWDLRQNTCLVRLDRRALMLPTFATNAVCVRCSSADGAVTLEYASPDLVRGVVTLKPALRGFLCNASFVPKADATVNRLELVPTGTSFGGFYTMNHFAARGGIANPTPADFEMLRRHL